MARSHRQSVDAGPDRRAGRPATVALVAAVLLVSACATVPRGTIRDREELTALGGGAILYLRFDTEAIRPILNAVIEDLPAELGASRAGELLDRTDSAGVALFDKGSPRRYMIAARGRYPTGRAAVSLTLNSSWKKKKTAIGERYWRSSSGLSLAFRSDSALVSDGEPFAPGAKPKIPASYHTYDDDAPLSGWITEPADRISEILGRMGAPIRLPIEELLFAVRNGNDTDGYTIETCLVASSPERARAMAAIMRLVGGTLGKTASPLSPLMVLLFSSPPILEGSMVTLRTPPLTHDEIALLCAGISIHLQQ